MTAALNTMFVLASELGGQTPAGGGAGQPAANPLQALWSFLPFIIILVGFFWFTTRSQKKRDQKRREMLDNIKPKDDVITIGGIQGRVVQVMEDQLVLRVDPEKDVKITIARTGISRKVGEDLPE
jgi:preprotein translocase subunit YajC